MITTRLHDVLRNIEKPIIFELGVYDAFYTNKLIMCCEHGTPDYYAFEPDPRNISALLPRLPRSVKFFPAAVGNITGKVPFHLSSPTPEGATASSSISPFKDHIKVFDWCHEEGVIDVDCWRLDDFCAQHGVDYITLIYMDVQGAERLVIEGARRILTKTQHIFTEFEGVDKPGTLYEHSSSLKEILQLMPGWKPVEILAGDALLTNTNDGQVHEPVVA